MAFSNDLLFRGLIIILAACGFLVARYIRHHKVNDKPLVCMVGFDCHSVVHSDYSKLFGVPVETLGMIYYAFVIIFYLFFANFGSLYPIIIAGVSSSFAFIFSVYLIFVQIFILKKGCSWCFISALISTLIFIATFF